MREEQIAVRKTLEIAGRRARMHGDHTVVRLARVAAPLPLDPGGVPAFLGVATFVDDPEGLGIRLVPRRDPLSPIPQMRLVPGQVGEEPLQGPGRYLRRQRYRLDALTRQMRELALHVGTQVPPRLAPPQTIIEFARESFQLPTPSLNHWNLHVDPPYKFMAYKE